MKTIFVLIIISFFAFNLYANDSLIIESRFKILEIQLEEVKRDQLNYKIEKDLIRETYSTNYDRINMGIAFILGVIGLIGYLGIRDINSIKKQYKSELDNLTLLRQGFETKILELENTKTKYDNSIKEFAETNKIQNNKLQVIEIKEKISKCLRESEFTRALEYCVVALEIAPKDNPLLRTKSVIYNRLGRFGDSKSTLLEALENEPDDTSLKLDLIEVVIFNKEIEEAQRLMEKYKAEIDKKAEGKLQTFLNILISYIKDDFNTVKESVVNEISKYDLDIKSAKINGWSVKEALFFAAYTKLGDKFDLLRNYLWFKEGQISGKEALERIDKINAS
jgi:hypothetical protein